MDATPRERLHIAGAGPYCAASCWCHKVGECLCDPPCGINVMNEREKFEAWFMQTYGPEPRAPSVEEQMRINHEYNEAKMQTQAAAQWRNRHEAALQAWAAHKASVEDGVKRDG